MNSVIKKAANNIPKDIKEKLIHYINKNNNKIDNVNEYDMDSIYYLFNAWHKIFPNIRQDVGCTSCRKAVVKFFNQVYQEWQDV